MISSIPSLGQSSNPEPSLLSSHCWSPIRSLSGAISGNHHQILHCCNALTTEACSVQTCLEETLTTCAHFVPTAMTFCYLPVCYVAADQLLTHPVIVHILGCRISFSYYTGICVLSVCSKFKLIERAFATCKPAVLHCRPIQLSSLLATQASLLKFQL